MSSESGPPHVCGVLHPTVLCEVFNANCSRPSRRLATVIFLVTYLCSGSSLLSAVPNIQQLMHCV